MSPRAPSPDAAAREQDGPTSLLDAMLDRVGCGLFQALTIPAIALVSCAESLQTNLLAFLTPCVGASFGVSMDTAGTIAAANFGASCVATAVFGVVSDRHGRKPVILVSIFAMLVGAIGSSSAASLAALAAWQAVSGIGLGGTPVAYDLLAEHSPPATRGAVLNVAAWFWSLGSIAVVLVAAGVLGAPHGAWAGLSAPWAALFGLRDAAPWRIFLLTLAAPVAVAAAAVIYVPESPYWLVEKGHLRRVSINIVEMAKANGVWPLPRLSSLTASMEREYARGLLDGTDDAERGTSADSTESAGASPSDASPTPPASLTFPPPPPRYEPPRLTPVPGTPADSVSSSVDSTYSAGGAWTPSREGVPRSKSLVGSVVRSLHARRCSAVGDSAPAGAPSLVRPTGALTHAGCARAARHAILWLCSGFGWNALAFGTAYRLNVGGPAACGAGYAVQLLVISAELPGAEMHARDARPRCTPPGMPTRRARRAVPTRPPRGRHACRPAARRLATWAAPPLRRTSRASGALDLPHLAGAPCLPSARNCAFLTWQVLATALSAAATLIAFHPLSPPHVALVSAMTARGALMAANAAMCVAAPELWPTRVRGTAVSCLMLCARLGAVPAGFWVYSSALPAWGVASGIAAANVVAGLLALTLPETAGGRLDAET